MHDNVIISIKGKQVNENGPDEMELVTEGRMICNDKGVLVSYQETELTGLQGTTTMLRINGPVFTLLREGTVNSQMVFEEGRRHLTMYSTPYGALTMGVNTRKMKVDLDETGGEIEIDYALEVDHAVAGENLFQIRVRPRNLPQ